jgi:hypothetical protein
MDKYEAYEKYQQFDETETNQGRPSRYAKERPAKKKNNPAVVRAQLSDFDDTVAAWVPSYAAALDPLHHERQWLIDSVGPFYRENVIRRHPAREGRQGGQRLLLHGQPGQRR